MQVSTDINQNISLFVNFVSTRSDYLSELENGKFDVIDFFPDLSSEEKAKLKTLDWSCIDTSSLDELRISNKESRYQIIRKNSSLKARYPLA